MFAAAGAAFVVAATAFAFVFGVPPSGGVAGVTGTPAAVLGGFAFAGPSASSRRVEPVRPGFDGNRRGPDPQARPDRRAEAT